MQSFTDEYRREIVAEYKASDLNVAEFARSKNLDYKTVYLWIRKSNSRQLAADRKQIISESKSKPMGRFVPVQVQAPNNPTIKQAVSKTKADNATPAKLTIQFGSMVTITIEGGANAIS